MGELLAGRAWSAVFVDRDGTLSRTGGYCHPDEFRLAPWAADAVRLLNRHGWPLVLVTNQSGVGKARFTEADLLRSFDCLREELGREGAWLDAIYYCPHTPQATLPDLAIDCPARKPRPGMLLRAAADLGLDLPSSFAVGDSGFDIRAGHATGCRTILVRSGWGESSLAEYRSAWEGLEADRIEETLLQAAEWIIRTTSPQSENAATRRPHEPGRRPCAV